MFQITVDLKDNVNVEEFATMLKKHSQVKKVTIVNEDEKNYSAPNGNAMSLKTLKSRIKKSEKEIKEGKGSSTHKVKKKMEQWMKEKGI